MTCQLPPPGWFCTRKHGHSGPCAAYPAKQITQGMDLGGVIFWIIIFSIFTGVLVWSYTTGGKP